MSTFDDDAGGLLSRDAKIGLNAYWGMIRAEYSGDNLIYLGCHYFHKADTSDSNWAIWKLTYSGDDVTLREGPLKGKWDDRATLSWFA